MDMGGVGGHGLALRLRSVVGYRFEEVDSVVLITVANRRKTGDGVQHPRNEEASRQGEAAGRTSVSEPTTALRNWYATAQ